METTQATSSVKTQDSVLDLSIKCVFLDQNNSKLNLLHRNRGTGDEFENYEDNTSSQHVGRIYVEPISPSPCSPPPTVSLDSMIRDACFSEVRKLDSQFVNEVSNGTSRVNMRVGPHGLAILTQQMLSSEGGGNGGEMNGYGGCSSGGQEWKKRQEFNQERSVGSFSCPVTGINNLLAAGNGFAALSKHLTIEPLNFLKKTRVECRPTMYAAQGSQLFGNVPPTDIVNNRPSTTTSQHQKTSGDDEEKNMNEVINSSFGIKSSYLIPPRKRFLANIRRHNSDIYNVVNDQSSDVSQSSPPTQSDEATWKQNGPRRDEMMNDAFTSNGSSLEEKRPMNRSGGLEKDEAYWERRRKNNEAAKRSRDIRRIKEEEIANKAVLLANENVQLRAQIAILRGELTSLQQLMIYNNNHQMQ